MTRFIIRRIFLSIPVMFGILVFVFVLTHLIPGDPCKAALGEKATEAICSAFRQRYGLDKPLIEQFWVYLGALAQGDLGVSLNRSRPVTQLLFERLPTTVELTMFALLFASVVGVMLGRLSALHRNSPIDVATMMIANFGISIPVFVLGLFLAYIFAVVLRGTPFALPPSGRLSPGTDVYPLTVLWGLQGAPPPIRGFLDFISNMYVIHAVLTGNGPLLVDALRHLILPAIALGTIPMAIIARMTRSSLLDVLGLDYVRTARAKGLGERQVVGRHGMRNAMIPVVTIIGLSLGGLLSGAVLTETIFGLTGIGRTITESIQGRDYIVVQGVVLVIAFMYIVVNLLVDISYALLDPRVRLR